MYSVKCLAYCRPEAINAIWVSWHFLKKVAFVRSFMFEECCLEVQGESGRFGDYRIFRFKPSHVVYYAWAAAPIDLRLLVSRRECFPLEEETMQ
jgi:hypothetical protein